MRIYLASSWRNERQPDVVKILRLADHEVYDFRNPPNSSGFQWAEVDPDWQAWDAAAYRRKLKHPRAVEGFKADFDAMVWCDACVLLLPCGRSAHLELGWCVGAGKRTIIWTRDGEEPELMAKMVDHICINADEVLATLAVYESKGPSPREQDLLEANTRLHLENQRLRTLCNT